MLIKDRYRYKYKMKKKKKALLFQPIRSNCLYAITSGMCSSPFAQLSANVFAISSICFISCVLIWTVFFFPFFE